MYGFSEGTKPIIQPTQLLAGMWQYSHKLMAAILDFEQAKCQSIYVQLSFVWYKTLKNVCKKISLG